VSSQVDPQDEVAVAEALPEFAGAFAFERFNRVQSATLPVLQETDDDVVVSAPTASGKTGIAEVAICETLREGGTACFLAPLRALTNEKEREWERLGDLGYSVYVVTGERDLDPARAERADVLVMTPEKADSATRKHDSRRYGFVTDVDCVVVDEVHLLDSERRGSVLEVTVARFRRLCAPRIVALSATMQNVDEVADWLDAPERATFDFGASARPVPLEADVKTYSHGENAFADKYRRLYRALDLAEPHLRDGGGVLTFVASRQDTVQAAKKARDELAERDVAVGARGDYDLHTAAQELDDDTLRQSVLDGVAFHHAGLSRGDKDLVEEWFRDGRIHLLFSTSTLAWGVNLPARCVVIRDTKYHDPLEGEVDMSPLDVRQMLGRAGRPGYDERGYAWIVCDRADADRYRRLLRDGTPIDSRLGDDLAEHLNAEVALGTVESVDAARDWLTTTFYWVRAGGADADAAPDAAVEAAVDGLVERGFLVRDGDALAPTELGRLASRYYLRLPTARRFADLAEAGHPAEGDVLRAVARAAEFDSVSPHSDEADAVDAVLGATGDDLEPGPRKVLAVLRSGLRGSTPSALRSDAWAIRQNAKRLLSALGAVCEQLDGPRSANLVRRVAARVETSVDAEAVGLTAIDGVGERRAHTLLAAGLTTPADVLAAGTAGLTAAGVGEQVAARLVENARELPVVDVDWGDFPAAVARGENDLCEVTVRSTAGSARAGLRVTVNGVEMTTTTTYLGTETVPVGVFGGDPDALEFAVSVAFPGLALPPVRETRTVSVRE
jgi:replicative superfamily II helicase